MAAATPGGGGGQQTWVPYEPTRDCSLGFCSAYCPQWCYIIFPPPPPAEFSDDGSNPTFSPLVIAIIGILASAFLLVSYYTIITKYCGGFGSLRRRLGAPAHVRRRGGDLEDGLSELQRHDGWRASPSNGLDEALISKITVYKYKRSDGVVDCSDCSVCLGEFRDDDSLRLLPKCGHAFHAQCIDTWLRSHSNCPLCRANIVSANLPSPPPPPPRLPPASQPLATAARNNEEIAIVIDDLVIGGEEDHPQNCSSNPAENQDDRDHDHDDQAIRRSLSLDSASGDRISIADVLQMSMEDEMSAAKDSGLWSGASSSRRAAGDDHGGKGGGRSRGLHFGMSPVAMKRSVSSGKFSLNRSGRGCRNGANANATPDDSNSST